MAPGWGKAKAGMLLKLCLSPLSKAKKEAFWTWRGPRPTVPEFGLPRGSALEWMASPAPKVRYLRRWGISKGRLGDKVEREGQRAAACGCYYQGRTVVAHFWFTK